MAMDCMVLHQVVDITFHIDITEFVKMVSDTEVWPTLLPFLQT